MTILLKRAYQPYAAGDGFRVLVDRLWPRGVEKNAAHIDLWLKEAAPSTELRKWFGHEPERWKEFRILYLEELEHNPAATDELAQRAHSGVVTLVYGAKDELHTHALVLKEYLEKRDKRPAHRGGA
ncbi:MAG TPA: DUF488 family protein [Sideroxyarcus sp.]|nr:DUF488 family protein [Sideroxyarcus sp.]